MYSIGLTRGAGALDPTSPKIIMQQLLQYHNWERRVLWPANFDPCRQRPDPIEVLMVTCDRSCCQIYNHCQIHRTAHCSELQVYHTIVNLVMWQIFRHLFTRHIWLIIFLILISHFSVYGYDMHFLVFLVKPTCDKHLSGRSLEIRIFYHLAEVRLRRYMNRWHL